MNPKQKKLLTRIIVALVLFVIIEVAAQTGILRAAFGTPGDVYAEFALFLIPYLIAGYDVIAGALRGLVHGHALDEDFLMTVATFGAFALVLFPDTEPHMAEGAAVMLFFQVGELFQSYAVDKSRQSIADMMDIAPEYANVMEEGKLKQVDPFELAPDDEFIVMPGERIPLDGTVLTGESQIDTAALTGESVPRTARPGDEVISGCVNLTAKLVVRATKPFEDSTVSRILELVENAAEKKARTENFITRFARVYTPIVVGVAAVLAIVPPLLFGGQWSDWILRGLTFLVVSCPCALVISVPLSFFGGIGGASRLGILVKGSNYLEALGSTETVVFDKTGTLTDGTFSVTELVCAPGVSKAELAGIAAAAETFSTHPIAQSVRAYRDSLTTDARPDSDNDANLAQPDSDSTTTGARPGSSSTTTAERVRDVREISGQGVEAVVDGRNVLVGNGKLMAAHDIAFTATDVPGTVLYVAADGTYLGAIVIADTVKPDAARAIADLRAAGVKKTVMLTGDRTPVARAVAAELGIDEVHAELLPQDKVAEVEALLAQTERDTNGKGKLAFVGDGINDAPVLTRADIGIAMGAMGSDAAIEAADIVLMNDDPDDIARAIHLARRTMGIVWQNIVFALGVKFAVLVLAAFGIANMWMAVFADVGVAVIAILNAMRAMNVKRYLD
ncbi:MULTISPECIES: heavy metal translocating P-type ATPase [Adlercreutzia]|uniref:Heavy metal translocating P-type ATPase n=4 Tax=Adlercreutzia TaxID=447020 RepID=A0A7K1T510_9ACTN|nr:MULTISPECIES: heavy metal translocating P-type ATPase [Adlercreutzia]MDR3994532.1 heavy metal translocating P-type ATPase [Adlercreutzia sp.]MEE0637209.1 heavy metal translocating P-type ATPase [Adlercreutzia sp.]MVN58678.1 heavy metal translocating P-type ATPase [Adlercreutzia rubneri]RDC47181.1 heavy metal translocating P-type ATPase [Adlercreutzia equolifaciens subsp. celatus]